jgi:molybdate transport system substrate-binding protein
MKFKAIILFILLAIAPFMAFSADAAEIHLSAAASLKDACGELIPGFTKIHPDTAILTNFGASGALAKQVVQGAPTDLFISADNKWADFLMNEKKGLESSRHILAYNKLVFAGKKDLKISTLADLKGLQRIAIGTPASVPAGKYAEQALQKAGVYDDLVKANKLVMAQDVRQALLYADRGEVDGAFVYTTDALLAKQAQILLVIPTDLYDRITYPMLMTEASAAREDVKKFYNYLMGKETEAILKKYGFETTK